MFFVRSSRNSLTLPLVAILTLPILSCGKGDAPEPSKENTPPAVATKPPSEPLVPADPPTKSVPVIPSQPLVLGGGGTPGPLVLGGGGTNGQPGTGGTQTDPAANLSQPERDRMEVVKDALKPLQVWLGDWRGTYNRSRKSVESNWVWDFQTNPEQPALVFDMENGKYLTGGRMTYLPENQLFQFSATRAEAEDIVYRGTWTEEVRNETDDLDREQRTFELTLKEVSPEPGKHELVFKQQENNRYLLSVARYVGDDNRRIPRDTIGTQRKDTSFALSDTDYGDKECIISQGLGTMTVSYQGKSYYVCCSGCKAAFEDDPAKWIAKAMARKQESETK